MWFINPGHPIQNELTRKTLLSSSISVVLQGDDMGNNNNRLTGVTYLGNGTEIKCQGISYKFDNLTALNYEVSMDAAFLPGIDQSLSHSLYGNDIDFVSTPELSSDVKVLAWASTPREIPASCQRKSPAIFAKKITIN